jgi:NAD(P)-dependent dehydrogenase (short-subunit alcohol dehydrogenase family)
VSSLPTFQHQKDKRRFLTACPEPDILVNNNGGPPRKDYTELNRAALLEGAIQNFVTPIELIQAVTPGMKARGFGRIVNITSLSVKMPIEGLDLSSGARAGLTAFLAGVCRQLAPHGVTVNNLLPGKMDTDRLKGGFERSAQSSGQTVEAIRASQAAEIPARRFGNSRGVRPDLCLFVLRTRRLHHRAEHSDGRRPLSGSILRKKPARDRGPAEFPKPILTLYQNLMRTEAVRMSTEESTEPVSDPFEAL